jgi:uncharacterized alkaline shock family protein YloU
VEVSGVPDDRSDVLPCGASLDDLLEQVASAAPPTRDRQDHQAHCPHCRATLAELTELWAPVHDLATEDVRAPGSILQTVMAHIRELSSGGWSAVLRDEDGSTRIAARVVGAIARLAAESVPNVSLALGGGRVATPAGAATDQALVAGSDGAVATDVGIAGEHVVVEVQIAVDQGTRIDQVADQVRQRVIRHLDEQTGLTVSEVNVVVVDVRPTAS